MAALKRMPPRSEPAATNRFVSRIPEGDTERSFDPPFRKILIANRGEIALRVILACKELGIQTVAVYSEADRDALHVRFADQDICIGPAPSAKSYLNIPQVIAAAEVTGAEAIHPGYGFLSENPHFVDVCQACGIVFIGPNSEIIRKMGNKAQAKATMKAAGVPLMPGSDGVVDTVEDALVWGERIGYPVIVKASAGGGGRGMRIVNGPDEMADMYNTARTEARAAFTDDTVYMEKYLLEPRHIEVQILGDLFGNIITLGERECSIQRRHQKLIEEAPSLQVMPKMREELSRTICRCLKEIGYQNAGTVEFLMDANHELHFIEMNTRIQVEHPITEAITGVDLVKAQLRIASGDRLEEILPGKLEIRGHAIECRINAEDPRRFIPSAGQISAFNVPGGNGVRVDTAQYAEGMIPPYYDSLIAKLIVHGCDRAEAIAKMERALSQFVVQGVETSISLHQEIFQDAGFRAGKFDTGFMERFLTSRAASGE